MSEETDPLDEALRFLKQQRDELKLKMHLAGKDAQDEWDAIEEKWGQLFPEEKPLTDAVGEAAESAVVQTEMVAAATLKVAPHEIKKGYERLRKLLE